MVGSSEWTNGWIARRRVALRKYKNIQQERIWSSSLLYYLNLFYTSAGGFGIGRLRPGESCTRPIVKRSRPSSPNGWSWKACSVVKTLKKTRLSYPCHMLKSPNWNPTGNVCKSEEAPLRLFGERCRDSWTCRLAVPSATCYLFTWADNFKLLAIGIQRSWCHICPMFCSVMSVRSGCLNGFSTVDHWPDRKNYMIFLPRFMHTSSHLYFGNIGDMHQHAHAITSMFQKDFSSQSIHWVLLVVTPRARRRSKRLPSSISEGFQHVARWFGNWINQH